MIRLEIGQNEQNQRLDRYLRKYLENAPLSYVYKAIRKDVKVNGSRVKGNTVLRLGNEVLLYIRDEDAVRFRRRERRSRAGKQFEIAYEDGNILVVSKPAGLLTHGDRRKENNTLTNQVIGYLTEKGDYDPETAATFAPAPVNRLDRNTTGLVLFAKNYPSLQELDRLIRGKKGIKKYYMTVVRGELRQKLVLRDKMTKDGRANKVTVMPNDSEGLEAETVIRPLARGGGYTLVEAELVTGRSHQIRAQLSNAGYPVIGDGKYGDRRTNQLMRKEFGLTAQLLHAYRLDFNMEDGSLCYLSGLSVQAELPASFRRIKDGLLRKIKQENK